MYTRQHIFLLSLNSCITYETITHKTLHPYLDERIMYKKIEYEREMAMLTTKYPNIYPSEPGALGSRLTSAQLERSTTCCTVSSQSSRADAVCSVQASVSR
jgi:hypothetical protein